jgi:hypothetical protein
LESYHPVFAPASAKVTRWHDAWVAGTVKKQGGRKAVTIP